MAADFTGVVRRWKPPWVLLVRGLSVRHGRGVCTTVDPESTGQGGIAVKVRRRRKGRERLEAVFRSQAGSSVRIEFISAISADWLSMIDLASFLASGFAPWSSAVLAISRAPWWCLTII